MPDTVPVPMQLLAVPHGRDGLALYLSAETTERVATIATQQGWSMQLVLRHAAYLLLDEAGTGPGSAPIHRAECRHTIQTKSDVADLLRALAAGYGYTLSEYLRHGVGLALDRIEQP